MYAVKIFLFLYTVASVKGKMDYRIVVPEFICDNNRQFSTNRADTTTIQFIGDGKIDSFKLNYETIGNPCRNTQRCNLIAWKVIRQLEKYLNNYSLTDNNSIEFNNTMLVPGFRYIFDIQISQGEDKEKTQVALNYVDKTYLKSLTKPLAYITLMGISSSKAHIPYILNAKITICSDITSFYFRWELLDKSQNFIKVFPDRGFELTIEPLTLLPGYQYNIKCYLINLNNSEVIAENVHQLTVESENDTLIVKLPVLYATVKIRHPIHIKPFITNEGSSGNQIKKTWSCIFNNKDVCLYNNHDELYIESGFLSEGQYVISIAIQKGSESRSASCLINVLNDVPSIEIDAIKTPVLPSSGIKIRAYVEDLRTYCTVQWKSPEGPYFIDLKTIPGNVDKIQHVVARRDLFLEELEDFSSDAVNKEYTLIIPPPTEDWEGLPNLDEDYKVQFLLEIKCPAAQLEENVEVELSEDFLNDSVTVSSLIEIEVAVAPKLGPLQVKPEDGIALETVFRFNCDTNVSREVSQWFLYKFGYIVDKREFIFSNQLGFGMAESVLPYGEDIKTFVKICTSTNSCHTIFGATVNTSLPTNANEENTLVHFKELLNVEEFYKAFGYALTISTIFEDPDIFYIYFCNETVQKINYLLSIYGNDIENWDKRVNQFITNVKEFSDELPFCEDVLNGLSKLRDMLFLQQKEDLFAMKRNLLMTNRKRITFENFKSYLDVSDMIITASSDASKVEAEKQLVENKIGEYLGSLCPQIYYKEEEFCLEYQSIIVVLGKLLKSSYNKLHIVPYEGNAWNTTAEIKLDSASIQKLGKDKLCLGKVVFKNYFGKPGISYSINLFDGSGENSILESSPITILLPIKDDGRLVHSIPQCLIYDNGWNSNCEFIKLISEHVQCHCPSLGTYYLEYGNILTVDTTDPNNKYHTTITTSSQTEQSTAYEEFTEKTIIITQETIMVDDSDKNSKTTKPSYYTSTTNSPASSNTIDTVAVEDTLTVTTTVIQNPGESVTDAFITTNDDLKPIPNNITPDTSYSVEEDPSESITTFISGINKDEASTELNSESDVTIQHITTKMSIEDAEESTTALTVSSPSDGKGIAQNPPDIEESVYETSTSSVKTSTGNDDELVTSSAISTEKTSTTVGDQKTDNNLYKNVFQADFNANFFTNFSFKFSLNATFGK